MLHEEMRGALVQPREGAIFWRNAIGSGRRRWQPAEPAVGGQHARYSPAHCCPLPLESHRSSMRLECHDERCLVKLLAEELGWSLTPRREDLSGLPYDTKPARRGSEKG